MCSTCTALPRLLHRRRGALLGLHSLDGALVVAAQKLESQVQVGSTVILFTNTKFGTGGHFRIYVILLEQPLYLVDEEAARAGASAEL